MLQQKYSIQLIDDCSLEKIYKSNRTCLCHGTHSDHCIHLGYPFACLDSVNSSIDHNMVHLSGALDVMNADAHADAVSAAAVALAGDDDAEPYYDLVDRNG